MVVIYFFSRDMNNILFDTSEYSDTEMLLLFGKKYTDNEFIKLYNLTKSDFDAIIKGLNNV